MVLTFILSVHVNTRMYNMDGYVNSMIVVSLLCGRSCRQLWERRLSPSIPQRRWQMNMRQCFKLPLLHCTFLQEAVYIG